MMAAVSEAPAVLRIEPGGPLEEPAVEVEDVAGIRLAAGRAAEEERHLAVRPGVLREVVVDAQGVLDGVAVELDADLHDLLAHRRSGVRGEVLERRRVLGPGHDDDRVAEGAVALEDGDRVGDRRELLADRHVKADEVRGSLWLMIASRAMAVLPVSAGRR
jgi:hypothetical protein